METISHKMTAVYVIFHCRYFFSVKVFECGLKKSLDRHCFQISFDSAFIYLQKDDGNSELSSDFISMKTHKLYYSLNENNDY